jgi:hypothetical protein
VVRSSRTPGAIRLAANAPGLTNAETFIVTDRANPVAELVGADWPSKTHPGGLKSPCENWALYQGTTLVVPQKTKQKMGFSPCLSGPIPDFACWEPNRAWRKSCPQRLLAPEHFGLTQTLRPGVFPFAYGTIDVWPDTKERQLLRLPKPSPLSGARTLNEFPQW